MGNGLGRLKNGNRSGDLSKVSRCGAKNRRGTPCGGAAMRNGRCRMHGGLSTGAKTPEGIERIRRAKTIHGRYSISSRTESQNFRDLLQTFRSLLRGVS